MAKAISDKEIEKMMDDIDDIIERCKNSSIGHRYDNKRQLALRKIAHEAHRLNEMIAEYQMNYL